jgi:hypothetical protein
MSLCLSTSSEEVRYMGKGAHTPTILTFDTRWSWIGELGLAQGNTDRNLNETLWAPESVSMRWWRQNFFLRYSHPVVFIYPIVKYQTRTTQHLSRRIYITFFYAFVFIDEMGFNSRPWFRDSHPVVLICPVVCHSSIKCCVIRILYVMNFLSFDGSQTPTFQAVASIQLHPVIRNRPYDTKIWQVTSVKNTRAQIFIFQSV